MRAQYDVAIVGGGVVGSAVAYYLKKHGYRGSVAIIEKDTTYANSCTARSAGGIRQQFSTPENIALSRFGLKLIRDLKAEFGANADVSFREQGYLILASPEGLPVLKANHMVQIAEGADNIILDPADLAVRFPWIVADGLGGGCFGLTGEGWLDPYSLMTLFRKAAVAMGAEAVPGEVTGVLRDAREVSAVILADGTQIATGAVVNAAGAGAGALAALAEIALPVGPRKRYVYVLDCPSATDALNRAPLTVDPSGIYFRPEGKHFICGLSPEEQEEPTVFDWDVDYSWFEERIWSGLAARVPAFEAVKVINAWVGHYDYNSFDQNAVIGRHPELANYYFANGFSGHGLQQAPAAGNAIAELIAFGGYRAIELARLGYERVAAQTPLYEQNVI
jgi:FAD-dependent oxidoreductase domain-containing protein 1